MSGEILNDDQHDGTTEVEAAEGTSVRRWPRIALAGVALMMLAAATGVRQSPEFANAVGAYLPASMTAQSEGTCKAACPSQSAPMTAEQLAAIGEDFRAQHAVCAARQDAMASGRGCCSASESTLASTESPSSGCCGAASKCSTLATADSDEGCSQGGCPFSSGAEDAAGLLAEDSAIDVPLADDAPVDL